MSSVAQVVDCPDRTSKARVRTAQPGIDVLGPLPPAIQITTTFSAGLAATSTQPEAMRELLAFFASPAAADIKRRNGMEAV